MEEESVRLNDILKGLVIYLEILEKNSESSQDNQMLYEIADLTALIAEIKATISNRSELTAQAWH